MLADSFTCIVRRIVNKQNIFTAHRLHLYQRLVLGGMSHSNVSLIYIIGSLILSIGYISGGLRLIFVISLIELCIGIWLDRKVAVDF